MIKATVRITPKPTKKGTKMVHKITRDPLVVSPSPITKWKKESEGLIFTSVVLCKKYKIRKYSTEKQEEEEKALIIM